MNPVAASWGAGITAAAGLVEIVSLVQWRAVIARLRLLAGTSNGGRWLALTCGSLLGAAALAVSGPVPAIVLMAMPPVLESVARRLAADRRAGARLASIPDEVRAIADSLSVGLSFEMAAREASRSGSRAGRDLAAFAGARAAGATVEAALAVLACDDERGDWAEVTAAVALNRRCGGDLVTPLRGIAAALELEEEGRKEARAALAQARFTAGLVCGLPLLVAAGGELFAPGTAAGVAGSSLGSAMAVAAAVLQGGSMVVIARLSTVAAR